MKKVVLLALVSTMTLSILGAGYALWFDTVLVQGTAQTGNVDVEWSIEDPGYDTDDLVLIGGGSSKTYTLDADFDGGALINVVHSPSDQLQLDSTVTPFPFIWIAASGKGTIVKVDTATGAIKGEYYSAPNLRGRDPSRTTVDANGNVWSGNRAEAAGGQGSVVHIGLLENNQCVDRNGDGDIDTSTGLGDVRAWSNAGGVDNDGGVDTADDECIIHYVRVSGDYIRHVSVDASNNVWTAGNFGADNSFDLVSPTGAILASTGDLPCGGYGGLVDNNGVLWSANRGPGAESLLRYDTNNTITTADDTYACLSAPNSYGLAADSAGNIWHSLWTSNTIRKFSPAGAILGTFGTGGAWSRGVAVTADDNIWVANSGSNTVTRLSSAGVVLASIPVGTHPTGVSVDAAGKVWSTNLSSNNASRINPATNAVDLTVGLGAGASPYNYSDMTGSTVIAPPDAGTWTIVHDSGQDLAEWGTVTWNGSTPGNSTLAVSAASSNDGVAYSPFQAVTDGVDLTVPDGRYLKLIVAFNRSSTTDADGDGIGDTPVLYDLTITSEGSVLSTEKDVSDILCQTVDTPTGLKQILLVMITNAYPSIDYMCDLDIHGVGTVPVHVEEVVLAGTPPLPLLPMPLNARVDLIGCTLEKVGGAIISLPGGILGAQLHQGDGVYCTLRVHLYNDLDPAGPNPGPGNGPLQDTGYGFTGSVTAVQYNESVYP